MDEEFLKRLGLSIARGVPQMATGFVDLAALPFTMTGLLDEKDVVGGTEYLTQRGLLPPAQDGLLNETTEMVSSALNPAGAVKGGLLGLGMLAGAKGAKAIGSKSGNIENVFSQADELSNEPVGSIRDQWIGGVSGLGDRSSAYDLPYVPGGLDYQEKTQNLVRESLGDNFKGYRLMHKDELEELSSGAMGSDLASFTLDKNIAEKFSNLAAFRNANKDDLLILEMDITPEHVWMMGKPGEKELVVNYGVGYNPSELKITKLKK